MKSKATTPAKKQPIVVKDLKSKKDPKGGGLVATGKHFPAATLTITGKTPSTGYKL